MRKKKDKNLYTFSQKQIEYILHKPARWNVKTGAVRSGKTFCDLYVIPMRVYRSKGNGLCVLIGMTVATLCRNIIDPMREMWGSEMISYPRADDSVEIFGKKCWLIGASRADQADKLRGSSIEFAYGDEITTWDEGFFNMLKSRLDRDDSIFDGTCNPEGPTHWFKRFLDSAEGVYLQEYTIDDNPYLDRSFVESLKKEYKGTVLYDRYILGKWTAAEGSVYPVYSSEPWRFNGKGAVGETENYIGVDFGGTGSKTAFVCVKTEVQTGRIFVEKSELIGGLIDCDALCRSFMKFYKSVGGRCTVFCDNAEPILIRSLKRFVYENGLDVTVRNARKDRIENRIVTANTLFSQGRLLICEGAKTLKIALSTAVFRDGARLDNGSSDIDTLDAFDYCIERIRV